MGQLLKLLQNDADADTGCGVGGGADDITAGARIWLATLMMLLLLELGRFKRTKTLLLALTL